MKTKKERYKAYILFLILSIVLYCGFSNIYGALWELSSLPMKPWGVIVTTVLGLPSSVGMILWFDRLAGEL